MVPVASETGFIAPADGQADILFTIRILGDGYRNLTEESQTVEYSVEETTKGAQAVRVQPIAEILPSDGILPTDVDNQRRIGDRIMVCTNKLALD
jgi:cold shock CspA family protein